MFNIENSIKWSRNLIAIALLSALLGACGGSDETESTPNQTSKPSTNQSPAAVISGLTSSDERTNLTYSGADSSDDDGSITEYSWSIDTGDYNGGQINLTSSGDKADLAIGEVDEDVTIVVTLTVTDNDGATDTQELSLLVSEIDRPMLPPFPSTPESGLTGTDLDGDGVRDDIEHAILNAYPLDIEAREFLRKASIMLNAQLLAGVSEDDIDDSEVSEMTAQVADCLFKKFGASSAKEIAKLEALMFDTEQRFDAMLAYSQARSGTSQPLVDAPDGFCRIPQD